MKVKLITGATYYYCQKAYRKGDVFDVDPVVFVPATMEDLTPKPIVAIKTVSAPKEEDKPKATEKKKMGK